MARRHSPNQLSLLTEEPPRVAETESRKGVEGIPQNGLTRCDPLLFTAPPFVAPDRQPPIGECGENGSSLPPYFADAIWTDRRRTDIDGPPHRFTIRLGDTIEAFV